MPLTRLCCRDPGKTITEREGKCPQHRIASTRSNVDKAVSDDGDGVILTDCDT